VADTPLRLGTPPADPPADGNRPAVEPLLLSARDLAGLLGAGVRTIRSWDASGRIPAPLRLSPGCVRWRRDEIRLWVDSGCPSREVWEARRASRPLKKNGRPAGNGTDRKRRSYAQSIRQFSFSQCGRW
jgi:prophage regulatory protein